MGYSFYTYQELECIQKEINELDAFLTNLSDSHSEFKYIRARVYALVLSMKKMESNLKKTDIRISNLLETMKESQLQLQKLVHPSIPHS